MRNGGKGHLPPLIRDATSCTRIAGDTPTVDRAKATSSSSMHSSGSLPFVQET